MLRRPRLLRDVSSPAASSLRRAFRSAASLEAILSHSHPSKTSSSEDQEDAAHLALYNYPTFAGAYSALAADLFHRRLRRRLLVLPFSSVEPFRAEDFKGAGFQSCYLLDFVGPRNFALELSRFIPSIVAFDHRQSTLARIPQLGRCPTNLDLRIDTSKSSARAAFDYFSNKLTLENPDSETCENLLSQEDEERVSNVVKYVEDADLRQWQLPGSRSFHTALRDERAKLNCVSNPQVFEQLMQLDVSDLLARGNLLAQNRLGAARKLIHNPFKIYLGRGLYGECLAIRADGDSKVSHEIGLELSKMSAGAGLRPIGAVVFMQRGLLKICLRTTDNTTNTAEIAKAHGGGGKPSSSSFALRMDEFSAWTRENT
ncbi:uncharacterized protein LOC123447992 [Hordeum vulgare subsp. vulgare]|nr:uncharacterized protein LOC123447992 [Hordeum vulgare subsp. vulgare]